MSELQTADSDAPILHRIERVRRETRRRTLTVARVTRLSPHMVRVTLVGDDLAGFDSAGYDDHVKLFFPSTQADAEIAPVSRDYTPRRHDPAAGELDVDFALHDAGPATTWAAQAAPGQTLTVGGPRGSFVVTDDFDWYLFVGDETALPAIARRLGELRAGCRAIAVVEVDTAADHLPLETRAQLDVHWLHRDGAPNGSLDRFAAAIAGLTLPAGDGYAWVAGESTVAKAVRQMLLQKPGIRREWLKAAGYWKQGAVALHERHED